MALLAIRTIPRATDVAAVTQALASFCWPVTAACTSSVSPSYALATSSDNGEPELRRPGPRTGGTSTQNSTDSSAGDSLTRHQLRAQDTPVAGAELGPGHNLPNPWQISQPGRPHKAIFSQQGLPTHSIAHLPTSQDHPTSSQSRSDPLRGSDTSHVDGDGTPTPLPTFSPLRSYSVRRRGGTQRQEPSPPPQASQTSSSDASSSIQPQAQTTSAPQPITLPAHPTSATTPTTPASGSGTSKTHNPGRPKRPTIAWEELSAEKLGSMSDKELYGVIRANKKNAALLTIVKSVKHRLSFDIARAVLVRVAGNCKIYRACIRETGPLLNTNAEVALMLELGDTLLAGLTATEPRASVYAACTILNQVRRIRAHVGRTLTLKGHDELAVMLKPQAQGAATTQRQRRLKDSALLLVAFNRVADALLCSGLQLLAQPDKAQELMQQLVESHDKCLALVEVMLQQESGSAAHRQVVWEAVLLALCDFTLQDPLRAATRGVWIPPSPQHAWYLERMQRQMGRQGMPVAKMWAVMEGATVAALQCGTSGQLTQPQLELVQVWMTSRAPCTLHKAWQQVYEKHGNALPAALTKMYR